MTRPANTKRLEAIYTWMEKYHQTHGYSPSIRDVASQFEISTSHVRDTYLTKMEANGWIARTPRIPRAMVFLREAA